MARNLKYQFKNAIDKNFKEGMDKHSMKHSEGIGEGRIYSYSDRRNLIDFTANFSNYMNENYREIKMIREIRLEHIQAFFNEKSHTCSKTTMIQYESKFRKVEQLVNETYKIKANLTQGYVIPVDKNASKIRNISMNREEYKRVLEVIENSRSAARIGIELSGRFALRVSEIVNLQGRDIDIKNNVIHIVDSKGGRDRDIVIREQDRTFCEKLKEQYQERERIVPLKEDSVNKFLNRALEQTELKDRFKNAKTGIHSIRKMVAQEYYDRCRSQGLSIKESLDSTSKYLGHGANREVLMKEYILNIK